MKKTKKELIKFLFEHFSEALTPVGCEIFADKLIDHNFVEVAPAQDPTDYSKSNYKRVQSMKGKSMEDYEITWGANQKLSAGSEYIEGDGKFEVKLPIQEDLPPESDESGAVFFSDGKFRKPQNWTKVIRTTYDENMNTKVDIKWEKSVEPDRILGTIKCNCGRVYEIKKDSIVQLC